MYSKHSTAIVCAAGSGPSFGFIQRVRIVWGDQVHLVALDTNPRQLVSASVIADTFVQVSGSKEPAFVEELAQILDRWPDAHVYPAVNSDFAALCKMRSSKLWPAASFVTPSASILQIVNDKASLESLLGKIAVPTPRSYTIRQVANSASSQFYFVKPRDGFGGVGAHMMTRADVLSLEPDRLHDVVIQELCDGPEVTADVFYDSDSDDFAIVCRERLEVKSGVCTKARLFIDPTLAEYGRRLGRLVKARGSFCFQVMRARGGWVVTDVNLRPGAGTALSCAVGADFFAAMHATRCGERGVTLVDTTALNRGDCYVTRQYTEYVTEIPSWR